MLSSSGGGGWELHLVVRTSGTAEEFMAQGLLYPHDKGLDVGSGTQFFSHLSVSTLRSLRE